jgi:hypothetical protein
MVLNRYNPNNLVNYGIPNKPNKFNRSGYDPRKKLQVKAVYPTLNNKKYNPRTTYETPVRKELIPASQFLFNNTTISRQSKAQFPENSKFLFY